MLISLCSVHKSMQEEQVNGQKGRYIYNTLSFQAL